MTTPLTVEVIIRRGESVILRYQGLATAELRWVAPVPALEIIDLSTHQRLCRWRYEPITKRLKKPVTKRLKKPKLI